MPELNIDSNNMVTIIAELSANHNGSLSRALETISAAKDAGADAIKLQTYTPDTITIDCDNKYFRDLLNGTIWEGRKYYDLYKDAYTPWEWHEELFRYAREEVGIDIFSSPFDKTAVDLLEKFEPSHYKIASFEIVDIPLIEYVASKGRPIIISTGVATLADIELAVQTCVKLGNENITLLKCTSSYPAPLKEANLLTIPNMKKTFGTNVGLSDHTMGASSAIAATALGATVIEKHFTLNRSQGGPDSSFSMEPAEFKGMVESIREVEKALGKISYELTGKAVGSKVFARSLFVVEDVKAGESVTEKNIRSIRPGYGVHPKYLKQILDKQFSQDVKRGTPLDWDLIIR
jgi:pseudaminic acid synthase